MDATEATQRFYEAVWPHRALVLRAAMIHTANAADAEDLAQETLLKAFRAMDTFRAETNAKAWLLTILRNARIDRLRTRAGSATHVSLDDLAADPAVADSTASSAWGSPEEILNAFSDADVIDALQGIAEELRWTLLLVDVEGMDHKDAADVLGVPVGTIKSRVHRARAMLRQVLLPLARQRRLVQH
ncbi:MAG: sigma-70 family RNA polymerase sigma factor [Tepidisphaeraceae bacterium]